MALAQSSIAQNRITITGTVTDTTGGIIAGANITALNKNGKATSTDANGKFVLDVEAGTVLKVSFVGYQDKQVTVSADQRTYKIVIKENVALAEEVIVTAYSRKQTREALVGSVTTVKPGNLKIPASNLTTALAGQVAGVIAYTPSGQPGQDNANFFIRGVTTFGYKRDPLILVDNVELTSSDLARIQVDDIESFSILKDASATALYGARGGNGVILVKTKEGKVGKAQINFRLENSISQSAKTIELADPITYMRLFNEATITRNPLAPRPFTENQILNTQATLAGAPGSNPYVYPAVDWIDMLFKDRTNTQRANLNISGGGGVAKYYFAGSYSNDNGILRTDIRNNNNNNVKFTNYQLRSNINVNLTDKTELVLRLSGNFNEYNGPLTNDASFSTDLYNVAMHTSPVLFPAYYEPDEANRNTQHILFGNTLANGGSPSNNSIGQINPYAALLRGHKNFVESRMLAQLELNQNLNFITSGLNFHGLFSTNRYSYYTSDMSYSPFYYNVATYDKPSNTYTLQWLNPQPTGSNVATEYLTYNRNVGSDNINTFVYFQGVLDYAKKIGENHNISSSLIGTRQQQVYSDAKDPRSGTTTLQYSLPYRNLTLAGRATYSYKSRYFLEFNFGYNGSERFSEEHRYGFFPAVGASWIISEEKFWGDLYEIFDRVKIRASHGLVGNDAIGVQRFYYLSDVNLNGGNSAVFGTNNGYGRNGVSIRNYENRDVTWETSQQTTLGLEFTLLKNLNVIAEVYRNHKYNILQDRASIPTTMGLEAPIAANIGKVDSKGIDLSIDGKKQFSKTASVSLRGNFTFAQNKFTQFEEPNYLEPYRYNVGQSLNRQYGYIAERLFVDDNEARNSPQQIFSTNGQQPMGGDIKYRDLNNDGRIDGADQTFIGYPTVPEIVYGFGITSQISNFDFSAFFQGQARVSFFIDPARTSPFIQSPDSWLPGNTQLLKAYADNHWSEENQNLYALYPRLGANGAQIENNRQNSTWWMRDGSFLRLKQLEIGYSIPRKYAQSLKLRNARIYFSGLNLLTWSPFKLWDPEIGGNGFNYPIQRVFNLGLNVNL
ncbi:TonB-dependent receptor [Mucilaginibacter sp. UR6-1]|uniref:SusC/RagA family TonB-linked outer membrane protein n=1 Tax=Mucilaginibacter sp. UR6-1 TaxID=1435643 RepID=UPI001E28D02F|nr:TonB-dependent receptor [Mucilaginibacter sp. UR6-1]MCC8410225.1 TonB-dependent receptor [Mucilaginibacter sp. UR6-1]